MPMRRKKKWLLILVIAFVLIQFNQPARNKSGQVLQTDISKIYPVPSNVQAILKAACYDCHSNDTRYPWYANIQPGGWWLAKHIKNGKEELNFSEFGAYSNRRQVTRLRSIENSIKDGTMPLSSYTLLHKDARLTKDEKVMLIEWTGKIKDSLTAIN
jgi:hypothetical protein